MPYRLLLGHYPNGKYKETEIETFDLCFFMRILFL